MFRERTGELRDGSVFEWLRGGLEIFLLHDTDRTEFTEATDFTASHSAAIFSILTFFHLFFTAAPQQAF